jgi:hypothetical protein
MTQQTQAQRLADELERRFPKSGKQAAAELRRLEEILALRHAAGIRYAAQINQLESVNAQLLEALRDMVNTLTDGPDESDIARVFSVARAAIKAAKAEA